MDRQPSHSLALLWFIMKPGSLITLQKDKRGHLLQMLLYCSVNKTSAVCVNLIIFVEDNFFFHAENNTSLHVFYEM